MNTPKKPIPKVVLAVFSGSSGILAGAIVHPFTVVKIRMQLSGPTGIKGAAMVPKILKKEGFVGLYSGLTAGMMRQATYTTTRMSVYSWLFDKMTKDDGTPPSFPVKAAVGMAAGACGALVGTPADLCLVRMTGDGLLAPEKRRNYTHVGNAFVRIVKEEGVRSLWTGCSATVIRASVVNAAQLGTYSELKQRFLATNKYEDGLFVHFMSSFVAGTVTAITAMPVDIIKTRIQNMKIVNGVPEHKGALDALVKLFRNEGGLALWRGFLPYYVRLGSHTVLIFVVFEQMQKAYRRHFD